MRQTRNSMVVFPLVIMVMLSLVQGTGALIGDGSGKDESAFSQTMLGLCDRTDNVIDELENDYGPNPYLSDARSKVDESRSLAENGAIGRSVDKLNGAIDEIAEMEFMYELGNGGGFSSDIEQTLSQITNRLDGVKEAWQEIKSGAGLLGNIGGSMMFVGLLTGLIVLVSILGLHVFGSGLAGASIKMLVELTGFIGIWFFLSSFGYSMLSEIPVFGTALWGAMTLSYFLGVFMNLAEG